ncbi:putative ribonuclease H-like domain-containing protein [Tanacetum coccineum]
MQSLEATGIFDDAYDDKEDVGEEADLNNLETTMNASPIPTTRIYKEHPKDQIIEDINSATQTRRMTKMSEEHAMVIQALTDLSWIKAMQEELLQFKLQNVWPLVDLPKGKRAIGTKWVYRNKKDERGIIVRNKARLMDMKSAFLYGTIEEEVYVCQTFGFEDPQFPDKVYVDDISFGSTKKSLCVEFEQMMHKIFQMSSMGELTLLLGLQVQQKEDGIFISQDKYLKGQPKLGLWYPRDSLFDLEAFSDSDYAGASLDRKSITGGCQFLGKRLISWQCKNQTIVANSTTKVEYVATANCCGHVLWIQNQMLDYGFNFMNTKIHIDNEGTISSEILMRRGSFKFMWFEDGISNEFGVKNGSCKVNAAKQDLVMLGES